MDIKEASATMGGINFLPIELLNHIFHYLNGRSLISCRCVTKKWKDVIDEYANILFDWKMDCFNEFGKCATQSYCHQSNLDWFNIYKNIFRWPSIARAQKNISQVKDISSDMKITRLRASKEGLLSVAYPEILHFFEITTLKKTPYEKHVSRRVIGVAVLSHDENEYYEVIHYNDRVLEVKEKQNEHTTNIRDVFCWSMVHGNIYYICQRSKLFKLCMEGDTIENVFMATWYGADLIYWINVYDDNVFLLTVAWKILKYSSMQIIPVGEINISNQTLLSTSINRYFFGKNVYINSFWGELLVYYDGEISKHDFPLVTAVHYHGNILILGTGRGEVYFYNCQDDSMFHNIQKNNYIDHHSFVKKGGGLLHINALEVVEYVNGVKLFVATENSLFVIDYTHLSS